MNRRLKEGIRRLFPRSLVRHRILGGPLRGSEIVTSWHDYPAAILGRTERPLLECFASHVRTGETWLDIGANFGYTALALCKLVGPKGRVFAFEPMLSTAGCICQARILNHLPQLSVIPIALGNISDLSTGQQSTTRGMIDSTLKNTPGTPEPFLVSGGDWLWPRIAGRDLRMHGVKIDVQGMEIGVLEGMAEVLRCHRPKLLVELHKGVSRENFFAVLDSLGYSLRGSAVEPLSGETEPRYVDDRTYLFLPADARARPEHEQRTPH